MEKDKNIQEEPMVEDTIVNTETKEEFIYSKALQEEPMVEDKKNKFLNPFDIGVTYVEFQKALGKKTVAEYCKGKLTKDQIDWLENELSIINKK